MTTLHTYPDLLIDGGRLAPTVWRGATAAEAVAATLRHDGEAVVLAVADAAGHRVAIGHAPGGLAA
jgi:hypothetical protein